MKKILVVDDEPDVVELLNRSLRKAGYKVLTSGDGAAALSEARRQAPDLILLDLMLPGLSGLEVCRVLKKDPSTAQLPIIMLTAKAEEVDRIVGLELGADDYVTKPFSPREIVLRVSAVMRRFEDRALGDQMLTVGGITLDRLRHKAAVAGKSLTLTTTEFKLLALLMERRGRVQSRDGLLNEVWGYESIIDTRTVDTHVRRLREKLGPSSVCIETVRGFGYRIGDTAQ